MHLEPQQVAWLMKGRLDAEAKTLIGLNLRPGTGGVCGERLRRARELLTEAAAELAGASNAPWQMP